VEERVSIIVPCFDAAKTLRECLSSLLAQRPARAGLEVLVVDNNSNDVTAEIAAATGGVVLLHEAQQGAYAARNHGLSRARGEILVFTDPDCVAEPDWLDALLRPLADPNVRISIGRSLLHGSSLAMQTLGDYEHVKDEMILGGHDTSLYYGHTNNMAVRREVFEATGQFEPRRRGADVICVRRCADHFGAESGVYRPEARVDHLEMDDLATYYRKVFTYGWSQALYREVVASQTAAPAARWSLVRRVADEFDYAAPRRCLLAGLMAIESMAWWLGQRRGRRSGAAEPES